MSRRTVVIGGIEAARRHPGRQRDARRSARAVITDVFTTHQSIGRCQRPENGTLRSLRHQRARFLDQ
jgi:hypothetical protein